MLVDRSLGNDLTAAATTAKQAEQAGYHGIWSSETANDPILPLLLAAEHTETVQLGTAIVVAFGRSPLTLAMEGWELNAYSHGRMILGLGSQVRAHITRRYAMPWSHPAARMAEFVLAMRAIWQTWQDGTELDFRGEFYTHTLMTPFFSPPANAYGAPRVMLAAVGTGMTTVAAEVADGLLVHPFTTERYLREVTLPTLDAGGRTGKSDFQLSYPVLVASGETEADRAAANFATRRQIAFYASTPAYRPVLDLHGWGDVQPALTGLSRAGRWDDMADLVTDEMLDAFSVCAAPDEVAPRIEARYGDLVDRVSLYLPHPDQALQERVVADLLATQ